MAVKIIIADDSEEIRNYFRGIIDREPDLEVIDTAENGSSAVKKSIELNPDIILMDIQMETKIDGIDAIEKIKKINPQIKIIVLTIHDRDDLLYKAYAAGAMDFIVKTSPLENILKSIRDVSINNLMLRPEIANRIMSEVNRIKEKQGAMKEILKVMMKITNTEFEIIKLVYDGCSYRDIAEKRFVEETTIRSEIYWILKKFNKPKMKDVITLLKSINFFEIFNIE